ncbi:MAG: hypothetical protein V1870_01630 [Candidatus Aenigmatarchaeota archaeon]
MDNLDALSKRELIQTVFPPVFNWWHRLSKTSAVACHRSVTDGCAKVFDIVKELMKEIGRLKRDLGYEHNEKLSQMFKPPVIAELESTN